MRSLSSPLSLADVRSLGLGEVVAVSGPIFTGRDEVHIRALRYLDEGKEVPSCLRNAVLYHCGPIMKKNPNGTWSPVAAGPTTSARMNDLEPRFIREFGIRAIIGKGGMDRRTAEAMKETGCVYLAATGGAAVSYAEGLGLCRGADWEDLGMAEALWHFEACRMGPLVVAIDAEGNSLYDRVAERVRKNRPRSQSASSFSTSSEWRRRVYSRYDRSASTAPTAMPVSIRICPVLRPK